MPDGPHQLGLVGNSGKGEVDFKMSDLMPRIPPVPQMTHSARPASSMDTPPTKSASSRGSRPPSIQKAWVNSTRVETQTPIETVRQPALIPPKTPPGKVYIDITGRYTEFPNLLSTLFWFRILLLLSSEVLHSVMGRTHYVCCIYPVGSTSKITLYQS